MNMKAENISNNQLVRGKGFNFLLDNTSKNKEKTSDLFSSLLENFSNDKAISGHLDNAQIANANTNKSNQLEVKKNDVKEKDNIKQTNYKDLDNEDKKIKFKKDNDKIEINDKDNVEEREELASDGKDEDNLYIVANKELINNIIEILKSTQNFSSDEIEEIKKLLQSNVKGTQKFDLKDFFSNLKEIIDNKNFTDIEINKFVKDISDTIQEFFDKNKISVNFLESVQGEEIKIEKSDVISKVVNEKDDKSEIISAFEQVLKDVLNSNLQDSDSENSQSFLSFNFNDSNNQNNTKLTTTDLLIEKFQNLISISENTSENSSMMNLEKNFHNTQNMISVLNVDAKNALDVSVKTDSMIKALDSTTQLRVLERVEEVLKTISASKDGSTISLRLDPPSLGTIKLDMTYKNGSLFARIIADSEEVENLLRNKASELQQVLRDAGIDAKEVNVFVASRDNYDNKENKNMKQQNANNGTLKAVKLEDISHDEKIEVELGEKNVTPTGWIA